MNDCSVSVAEPTGEGNRRRLLERCAPASSTACYPRRAQGKPTEEVETMPATRVEVRQRRPLAGGVAFGEIGPYEELKGRLYFSIDPLHSANRRITDVELAPRAADGRVEWSSDVSLLVPV